MTKNLFISLLLWLLIALAAWPVFVSVNAVISFIGGESSVIDLWQQEPKRNLVAAFVQGYKASAVFAAGLGLVAVIDFQLLTKNRLTGYFAGVFVILACTALAFVYYKNPWDVMIGFALTGLVLWFLYKLVDIGFRIRRTG